MSAPVDDQSPQTRPPGWYVPDGDPSGTLRWWDGSAWGVAHPDSQHRTVYELGPKQSRRWPWVVAGIVVGFLLVVAGCVALVSSAVDEIDENVDEYQADQARRDAEATRDVAINADGCTTAEFGRHVARGTVTNGSAERSDYTISVVWEDPTGRRVAEGGQYISNLEPGQPADWEAGAVGDIPPGATCRVADVTRWAS